VAAVVEFHRGKMRGKIVCEKRKHDVDSDGNEV
jgi:hypothetical protein